MFLRSKSSAASRLALIRCRPNGRHSCAAFGGVLLPKGVLLASGASESMTDLTGKVGLVVGVANKRSLSWAIAQAAAQAGATVVLTYQGRFEEHVGELADTLTPRPLVLPLDVQNDAEIDAVYARIQQEYGGLDFLVHGVAFANRDDITNPFVQTSREGFKVALDISAYSLIALARGASPLMEARGGGSIVTLTYLGSTRVFPNYNVMGVAKAALEAASGISPPISARRTSASTRSPPDRSRRWLPPGSVASRTSSASSVNVRRCGARSRPARWPMPRSSCSLPQVAASPARS